MRAVAKGKAIKAKATRLHAELVRSRGRCERCGKTSAEAQLQCAHIFSRNYSFTRTDENNAWCLCAACHRHLTINPYEHVKFAIETKGQAGFEALRDKAYSGVGQVMRDPFWRAEVVRIESLLRETVTA